MPLDDLAGNLQNITVQISLVQLTSDLELRVQQLVNELRSIYDEAAKPRPK